MFGDCLFWPKIYILSATQSLLCSVDCIYLSSFLKTIITILFWLYIIYFHDRTCIVSFDDQESFWRIPATLSISQLRSVAASLDQADESVAKVQEETEAGITLNPELGQNHDDEGHESQELRAQALRALLLARQRKRSSEDTKRKS